MATFVVLAVLWFGACWAVGCVALAKASGGVLAAALVVVGMVRASEEDQAGENEGHAEPLPDRIIPWPPAIAKARYLARALELDHDVTPAEQREMEHALATNPEADGDEIAAFAQPGVRLEPRGADPLTVREPLASNEAVASAPRDQIEVAPPASPAAFGETLCGDVSFEDYLCTRAAGHPGDHVAHTDVPVARWKTAGGRATRLGLVGTEIAACPECSGERLHEDIGGRPDFLHEPTCSRNPNVPMPRDGEEGAHAATPGGEGLRAVRREGLFCTECNGPRTHDDPRGVRVYDHDRGCLAACAAALHDLLDAAKEWRKGADRGELARLVDKLLGFVAAGEAAAVRQDWARRVADEAGEIELAARSRDWLRAHQSETRTEWERRVERALDRGQAVVAGRERPRNDYERLVAVQLERGLQRTRGLKSPCRGAALDAGVCMECEAPGGYYEEPREGPLNESALECGACGERGSRGFYCTLPAGHTERHSAEADTGDEVESWGEGQEASPNLPALKGEECAERGHSAEMDGWPNDNDILYAALMTFGIDGFDGDEWESYERIAGALACPEPPSETIVEITRGAIERMRSTGRIREGGCYGCYGLQLAHREVAALLVGKGIGDVVKLLEGGATGGGGPIEQGLALALTGSWGSAAQDAYLSDGWALVRQHDDALVESHNADVIPSRWLAMQLVERLALGKIEAEEWARLAEHLRPWCRARHRAFRRDLVLQLENAEADLRVFRRDGDLQTITISDDGGEYPFIADAASREAIRLALRERVAEGTGPEIWPLMITDIDPPAISRTASGGLNVLALVATDMLERHENAKREYGVPLRADNGRDALRDVYEEQLDACAYARQNVEEVRVKGEPIEPSVSLYNGCVNAAIETRRMLLKRDGQ